MILGGETEIRQAHEGGGQAELEQSPYRQEVLPLRVSGIIEAMVPYRRAVRTGNRSV